MEESSKEKNNILKKIKNIITQKVFINLIYAIIISIYLISFNTIYTKFSSETLTEYVEITSFAFLIITIIIFEIAYKKDSDSIALNGIEFLALSIYILLIKYIPKSYGIDTTIYILIGSYSFLAYYVIKNIIIYTKERKKELDQLSDIKEIVKDEPIKKETKRKNKPVE